MERGAIAAGHPLTAEAGARVLREGGNAVDAAVAAMLASFVCESPLTGFGAGGFMLVHRDGEQTLLDFFVEVPGRDGVDGRADLRPIELYFDETPQVFNCGEASCAVPGTAPGMAEAVRRFGTASVADLATDAVRMAAEGVLVTPGQAGIYTVLEPILRATPEIAAVYAPEGRMLRAGDVFRWADLAEALSGYASEGPELFMTGTIGGAVCDWVLERGGTLAPGDMAGYGVLDREPIRVPIDRYEVVTNPPPSSGGVLIAFCLGILEELGAHGPYEVARALEEALRVRGGDFPRDLYRKGMAERLLAPSLVGEAAARARRPDVPGPGAEPVDRLGQTTHISVMDADGLAASVTCSNGSGSGVVVPGTGVHVNNMLGEEDLNPLGFHTVPPGLRMTSMMAPTVVLSGGDVAAGVGSGGSNRLRSAILQTVLHLIDGLDPQEAVDAGRIHVEGGCVQAEPDVDPAALERLESHGREVVRWRRPNLYFGGVQTVARRVDGSFAAGGDPRRGGAGIVVG